MREPKEEVPTWWSELLAGDPRRLDEWLVDQQADPFDLSGIPPLEELSQKIATEMRLGCSKQLARKPKNLRELLKGPARLRDLRLFSGSTTRPFPLPFSEFRGRVS